MSMKHCAKLFQKLSLNTYRTAIIAKPTNVGLIHTTQCRQDLEEFFEDPANLGKEEIKVGRSWKISELRDKSNEDLHKLWYVLLKEKNMLLTMEHYHKETYTLFPNPERIDKVEESMKNLETAIRERNKAYYQLETGETGERVGKVGRNPVGLKTWRYQREYASLRDWDEARSKLIPCNPDETEEFLKLFAEKNRRELKRNRKIDRRYVRGLLRRFPKLDLEYLQELYPEVDVQREVRKYYTQGHFEKRSDVKT